MTSDEGAFNAPYLHYMPSKAALRGRPVNARVERAFELIKEPNSITKVAICRHCGFRRSRNTTKLSKHLDECESYYKWLQTESTMTKKLIQTKINHNIQPLTSLERRKIKKSLARAVYKDNLPFTIFATHKELSKALKEINPGLELPSRNTLANSLLDDEFQEVSAEVNRQLHSETLINLTADETTSRTRCRILSICANIHGLGAFFLDSQSLFGEFVGAEFVSEWIIKHIDQLLNPEGQNLTLEDRITRLQRLNSICFDTCETQLAAMRSLKANPALKHVFFVLCESHSLQLLFKDIIESVPRLARVVDDASKLATAFMGSSKQLGRLREVQKQLGLGRMSFVLAVITRWGTHFGLLRSVMALRAAITQYFDAITKPNDPSNKIGALLTPFWERRIGYDEQFWRDLKWSIDLMEPFDEALRMSESDRNVLGYIIPRWRHLHRHFASTAAKFGTQEPALCKVASEAFPARWKR